jgi:hypothetical protein
MFTKGGWREVRLDINPAVTPDIVASMTDMSPVASGSVQAIFSAHNLEHLYPHQVPVVLAEFRRVLAPAGVVVIGVPDLQKVAELVAADRLEEPAYQSPMGPIAPLDILYGLRTALAAGNLFMAHHTGFTARTLANTFATAGFARTIVQRQSFALLGLAFKTEPSQAMLSGMIGEIFPEQGQAVQALGTAPVAESLPPPPPPAGAGGSGIAMLEKAFETARQGLLSYELLMMVTARLTALGGQALVVPLYQAWLDHNDLSPDAASVWYEMGLAMRAANNLLGADAALRRALALKPGYAAARLALDGKPGQP